MSQSEILNQFPQPVIDLWVLVNDSLKWGSSFAELEKSLGFLRMQQLVRALDEVRKKAHKSPAQAIAAILDEVLDHPRDLVWRLRTKKLTDHLAESPYLQTRILEELRDVMTPAGTINLAIMRLRSSMLTLLTTAEDFQAMAGRKAVRDPADHCDKMEATVTRMYGHMPNINALLHSLHTEAINCVQEYRRNNADKMRYGNLVKAVEELQTGFPDMAPNMKIACHFYLESLRTGVDELIQVNGKYFADVMQLSQPHLVTPYTDLLQKFQ